MKYYIYASLKKFLGNLRSFFKSDFVFSVIIFLSIVISILLDFLKLHE